MSHQQNLTRNSNYIVDVVMKPKFGNSSISMREVITTSFFIRFYTEKAIFVDRFSWFKFNNLGLALGVALKCFLSVVKWLKLKLQKFWGLIPKFVNLIIPCQVKIRKGN